MARDHPLADRRALRLAEIPQLPVAVATSTNPRWERYWSLGDELGAASRPIVRVNSTLEELELVAAGRAVSVTTASAARYLAHPAVRYVPIVDLRPCTLGLAWDPALEGAYLRGFVATALQVRDLERELVAFIEDPFGTERST
jgi:DNA-binding transcriptional LysR family regulator